ARPQRARRAACRVVDVGRLAARVCGLPRGPPVSFAQPLALVALVAVPVLLVLWIRNERRRRAGAARFANLALLPNLVPRPPGRLRYLPLALFLVALTAMIVGVARPHANLSIPRKEATVVLAIDVSRSMTANDVQPSRLDAARA